MMNSKEKKNVCCFCFKPEKQDRKLYLCQHPDCKEYHFDKPLCLKCGQQAHSNKQIFQHTFDEKQSHVTEVKSILDFQKQIAKTLVIIQTETSNENYTAQRTINYGIISINRALAIIKSSKIHLARNGISTPTWKEICNESTKLTPKSSTIQTYSERTAYIQAVFFIFEIGGHIYRYNQDIISKGELQRLCVKSTTSNVAAFTGGTLGAAVGIAFAGSIGGIVGGMIGGVAADYASRYFFDKFIYDEEKKEQEEDIKEALLFFSYICAINDIWNNTDFNRKELENRYHQRALNTHPDRPNGSHIKFEKVLKYYNILVGMITEKEKKVNLKDSNKDKNQ